MSLWTASSFETVEHSEDPRKLAEELVKQLPKELVQQLLSEQGVPLESAAALAAATEGGLEDAEVPDDPLRSPVSKRTRTSPSREKDDGASDEPPASVEGPKPREPLKRPGASFAVPGKPSELGQDSKADPLKELAQKVLQQARGVSWLPGQPAASSAAPPAVIALPDDMNMLQVEQANSRTHRSEWNRLMRICETAGGVRGKAKASDEMVARWQRGGEDRVNLFREFLRAKEDVSAVNAKMTSTQAGANATCSLCDRIFALIASVGGVARGICC